MSAVHIFTIADASHFIGLVGLVASLRAHGLRDRVTVLDLGLTPRHRELLGSTCEWVTLPEAAELHPWQLSAYAACVAPEGVVAYLDCDVIATDSLQPVIDAAESGSVCVGLDPWSDRWYSEWADVFGLRAPLRHEPYVNSGVVIFAVDRHPELLDRWWELSRALDPDRVGRWRSYDVPTGLADQDALNALLMSEVAADAIERLPEIVHDPSHFDLRVEDASQMVCRVGPDGRRAMFVHGIGVPKPWAPRAWRVMRRTAYVRCLERLLASTLRGDAAPLRLEPRDVPRWLRPGVVGWVARFGSDVWSWAARTSRRWRRVTPR